MDYHLPDGDGFQAAGQILARAPATRIVMLTADPALHVLERAAALGVCGFLPKDGSLTLLLQTLRHARVGNMVTDPTLLAKLAAARQLRAAAAQLTPREMDVLRLLAAGSDAHTSARRLGIPPHLPRLHQVDPGQTRRPFPARSRGHGHPQRPAATPLAPPHPAHGPARPPTVRTQGCSYFCPEPVACRTLAGLRPGNGPCPGRRPPPRTAAPLRAPTPFRKRPAETSGRCAGLSSCWRPNGRLNLVGHLGFPQGSDGAIVRAPCPPARRTRGPFAVPACRRTARRLGLMCGAVPREGAPSCAQAPATTGIPFFTVVVFTPFTQTYRPINSERPIRPGRSRSGIRQHR
jgi:FixJ family two-component response regulator